VVPTHHISPVGVKVEFSNFNHVIDALLIELRLEFRDFFLHDPRARGIRILFVELTFQLELLGIKILIFLPM